MEKDGEQRESDRQGPSLQEEEGEEELPGCGSPR